LGLGMLSLTAAPLWSARAEDEAPASPDPKVATHEQARIIAVKGTLAANRLQTLCVLPTGEVAALVGLPRYGAPTADVKSEVHLYKADGTKVKEWTVSFPAQSINTSPEGTVFVAGSGKIAEFEAGGSLLREVELAHVAEALKDAQGLRQRAEQQLEAERKSLEAMTEQFKKQQADLEAKGDKLTAQEKAQLQMVKANLKSFQEPLEEMKKRTVDSVVRSLTVRLSTVNAVAVTEQDVFVATGEVKGFGYSVWRMNRQFKEPKQILSGLGGCCGQMDIQAGGGAVFVAENTRHRVGKYDRDGKRLASFGKRGRDGDPECFGSCCNPMNTRLLADGTLLTAESEGYVKRFSADGTYLGNVGTAKLQGGCKNVAVAAAPDGDVIYFCDQPGSRIIVLTKKSGSSASQ
ncbi:MAG TPA: hypothetical protein PKD86_12685, partial [Gemmatales bacterium]|nr:hypothetical protein [Gemmatales bacterium]